MKTINYKFNDGTSCEIEVSQEIYSYHLEILQKEKRNHWTETRRHQSLEDMIEKGEQFVSYELNPLTSLIAQEENIFYERLFSKLKDNQRELLEMIYIDGKTMEEIAKEQNLSGSTIRTKLSRIIKKLDKLMKNN